MRPTDNELYEDWCARVEAHELDVARKKLKKGEDPEKVLEEMSKRLYAKLMHPVIQMVKEESLTQFDAEKSRKDYETKYLKNHKPIADHVVSDDLDKNDI